MDDMPTEEPQPLTIAGVRFNSRLITGTGKYPSPEVMVAAMERSGCEMVTVAVGRIDLENPHEANIIDYMDLERVRLLPNTAGAYTVEQACQLARLGREAFGTDWVKLEVIGDRETLLPDPVATIRATEVLVKEGFVVLPYTNQDPIVARHLEQAGAATVMPLGSPIGSGQGLPDFTNIQLIRQRVSLPVIVDAGIGAPSDAALAMEIGADAVLINTAIARAGNPPLMAEAMKQAVEAGRKAFLAGRIPRRPHAVASTPREEGFVRSMGGGQSDGPAEGTARSS